MNICQACQRFEIKIEIIGSKASCCFNIIAQIQLKPNCWVNESAFHNHKIFKQQIIKYLSRFREASVSVYSCQNHIRMLSLVKVQSRSTKQKISQSSVVQKISLRCNFLCLNFAHLLSATAGQTSTKIKSQCKTSFKKYLIQLLGHKKNFISVCNALCGRKPQELSGSRQQCGLSALFSCISCSSSIASKTLSLTEYSK